MDKCPSYFNNIALLIWLSYHGLHFTFFFRFSFTFILNFFPHHITSSFRSIIQSYGSLLSFKTLSLFNYTLRELFKALFSIDLLYCMYPGAYDFNILKLHFSLVARSFLISESLFSLTIISLWF